MIPKRDRYMLAAMIAADMTRPLVREEVQTTKAIKAKTLAAAIAAFGCDPVLARDISRQLEPMSYEDVRKKWPRAMPLFAFLPPETTTSGKPEKKKELTMKELLDQYNAMRKELDPKWKSVKSANMNKPALLFQIGKLAEQIVARDEEKKRAAVEATKGKTVVANGAYKSGAAALNATGHTERGENKSRKKYRAKLARMNSGDRAADASPTPTGSSSVPERTGGPSRSHTPRDGVNTITLADVARELGVDPRVARAKARRHTSDLPSTVGDDHWTFAIADKQILVDFIKGATS